jgi:predicted MFS family arabinose efflux permease
MSITNIGQAVGMAATGFAAKNLGYTTTFIIFALLNLLLLPLMKPAFKTEE